MARWRGRHADTVVDLKQVDNDVFGLIRKLTSVALVYSLIVGEIKQREGHDPQSDEHAVIVKQMTRPLPFGLSPTIGHDTPMGYILLQPAEDRLYMYLEKPTSACYTS